MVGIVENFNFQSISTVERLDHEIFVYAFSVYINILILKGLFIMVATVVGILKKPYRLDNGKSGVSCRVSLHLGEYIADRVNNDFAAGEHFIEVKSSVKLADVLNINDVIYVELDDDQSRLKSALLRNNDGSFTPIEV